MNSAEIDPAIYNGNKKIDGNNKMFMNREWISECLRSIKIKNTEGFDRIPQRILVDGCDSLLDPLTELSQTPCPHFSKKAPNQIEID